MNLLGHLKKPNTWPQASTQRATQGHPRQPPLQYPKPEIANKAPQASA